MHSFPKGKKSFELSGLERNGKPEEFGAWKHYDESTGDPEIRFLFILKSQQSPFR